MATSATQFTSSPAQRAAVHEAHLAQAQRAFKCDPTPRLATTIKQLVGALRYERRQVAKAHAPVATQA